MKISQILPDPEPGSERRLIRGMDNEIYSFEHADRNRPVFHSWVYGGNKKNSITGRLEATRNVQERFSSPGHTGIPILEK